MYLQTNLTVSCLQICLLQFLIIIITISSLMTSLFPFYMWISYNIRLSCAHLMSSNVLCFRLIWDGNAEILLFLDGKWCCCNTHSLSFHLLMITQVGPILTRVFIMGCRLVSNTAVSTLKISLIQGHVVVTHANVWKQPFNKDFFFLFPHFTRL